MNSVVIMGRLTADPELRQTANNTSTCTVTVAVNRDFVQQGQERQADFITVVAWRQTAEFICKYFSKGQMIAVEGQLRSRSYDDKRYPDVKHYVTEILADRVHFCGSKNDNGNNNNSYNNNSYNNYNNNAAQSVGQAVTQNSTAVVADLTDFTEVVSDDDLPF